MVKHVSMINFICLILRVIGLFFHLSQLFHQYLSGKTVVNMKVGRRYENIIPIRLKHNQLPDYIVKHVPEFTFITFICNFGGILSLWLVFSIMSVAQDIAGVTTKFIMSKCTLNFNINNT